MKRGRGRIESFCQHRRRISIHTSELPEPIRDQPKLFLSEPCVRKFTHPNVLCRIQCWINWIHQSQTSTNELTIQILFYFYSQAAKSVTGEATACNADNSRTIRIQLRTCAGRRMMITAVTLYVVVLEVLVHYIWDNTICRGFSITTPQLIDIMLDELIVITTYRLSTRRNYNM